MAAWGEELSEVMEGVALLTLDKQGEEADSR
jgi:hypothetical protein